MPITFAIAKEVVLAGIKQNEDQVDDYWWIANNFSVSVQNLEDFMYGFTTPPSLIVGGYTMEVYDVAKVIKMFCPHTDDPTVIEHNRYKVYHLHTANRLLKNTSHRHPINVSRPIYDLCQTQVYKDDSFYLLGIEASRRHFISLSLNILNR